jgi:DNA helicase-2/ATP-dependent DNA helicase PcrA
MRPSPFISEASSAFTMIGQIPFSFKKSAAQERFAGIGKHIEGSQFDVHSSEPVSAEEEAVLKKYKKGTKIYHDDYGYGVIQKCELKEGEVVAIIQFENGAKKKFLPKYQRKSLDIIK